MVVGNPNKINLSTSFFERIISDGNLYVDKTRMIENFLNDSSDVNLIARQRRMGKSLNMDMVRCFLTDKTDLRHLFMGLYIESSSVWEKANSSPVFSFDFRLLQPDRLEKKLYFLVCEYMHEYVKMGVELSLSARDYFENKNIDDPGGLYYLTETACRATGKRSYILIDEYDKLLMENYGDENYAKIRDFEKAFLSAGLKGNQYLEKALITGVMRVSKESMFSDLNNIKTFDIFKDDTYTYDYGFTEAEILELQQLIDFDIKTAKNWYNGINIDGHPVYNTYSMMSFLNRKTYECYWAMSGSMNIISNLLNDSRWEDITKLMRGEQLLTPIENRISLEKIQDHNTGNEFFYSLLVQGGYLSLQRKINENQWMVNIPNQELFHVWKNFILQDLYKGSNSRVVSIFDNINCPHAFKEDLEEILTDSMSYHDLFVKKGEDSKRVHERVYHIFILGLLSGNRDMDSKRPLSNRESGNGRYDILVERHDICVVFELKACEKNETPEKAAQRALEQIDTRRYGLDVGKDKKLVKVGVGFKGKNCRVAVR